MSVCAKPLVCDTPLPVSRSLRSAKAIAKPKTNPSGVHYSIWWRHISKLRTSRIGCEVGLDFYEPAERASNGHNVKAIHIPYIALHIFRVIT